MRGRTIKGDGQMDLKKIFKKKDCKVQVKKIKVTAKDIQENCVRIKAAMDKTKVGTEDYEALQAELDKEESILKKCKDANQVISLDKALVIGGTTVALVFFIALTREYPTALKVASMILKFVPFKG
jgi:thiamine monophosphate kinase